MNFRRLVFYAGAGLAGWWGVAWSEGASKADILRAAHSSAVPPSTAASAAASLHAIQRHGSGSAELSRIAALVAGISGNELPATRKHIESLPPSAIREFALAMIEARNPPASENDPSAVLPDTSNHFLALAESMAAGARLSLAYADETYGDHTLSSWVAADPATATAAILKMPAGSDRQRAVDIAAQAMAYSDPALAMEFVFKSGEQQLYIGASQALARSMIQNPSPDTMRQYFDRMTPTQRNSILSALALTVPDLNWNSTYSQHDDAHHNAKDPLHRSDIGLIACGVLQAKVSCPGLENFMHNLDNFPQAADEARQYLESLTSLTSAQRIALEIFDAERLKTAAAAGGDVSEFISGDSFDSTGSAVLDRAAPTLLPQLARSGRLPEAVQLLDRISEPDIRRTSLEAVLPYWMDADPNAARAAFDAAPLTALERERWQRHPAFLKHSAAE